MPFRLLLVTEAQRSPAEVVALAARALSGSPPVAVLLRRPGASARELLSLASELSPLTRHLFVGGRPDVAAALGLHLHLPAHGVSPAEARAVVGDGALISCAVHDEAEAERALGADLALVSPVYPPGSKPDDDRPTLGVGGFLRLAGRLACPAFALGGIDATRLHGLGAAGGVAVSSAVWRASDPAAAVRGLLTALESLGPRPSARG